MIKLVSELSGLDLSVIRGSVYVLLGLIAGAALWSRDISEFIAWALVLYLAYRLWKKDDLNKEV